MLDRCCGSLLQRSLWQIVVGYLLLARILNSSLQFKLKKLYEYFVSTSLFFNVCLLFYFERGHNLKLEVDTT